MRLLAFVIVTVALCAVMWTLGTALSSDAIGMAVGVVFGVLASLPTALLLLHAREPRRTHPEDRPQAPIVVVTPPAPALPEESLARKRHPQFRVVGERLEMHEEGDTQWPA